MTAKCRSFANLSDMKGSFDTVVVGGGIVGLSVAVRPQESGRVRVRVDCRSAPANYFPRCRRVVPDGLWEQNYVLGWAQRAFDVFSALAEVPGSGVVMRHSLMLPRSPRRRRGGLGPLVEWSG